MSDLTRKRIERVCLALEAASADPYALDVAASLAAALDAELAGFFVEDVNVLRAAAFSFTREMGLTSAVARPMELEEVERALRAQARAARLALERTAEALRVRWSFTTVRGAGVTAVLAMTSPMNLTVMAPRSVLYRAVERPAPARASPVAVVFDGSPGATDALLVASSIAAKRKSALIVLLCPDEDHDGETLREMIAALPMESAHSVRYGLVDDCAPAATASAARAVGAGLLVMDAAAAAPEATGRLARLLMREGTALVVVSR